MNPGLPKRIRSTGFVDKRVLQVASPKKQVFPLKSFFSQSGEKAHQGVEDICCQGEAEMAFPEIDHFLAHGFGWLAIQQYLVTCQPVAPAQGSLTY